MTKREFFDKALMQNIEVENLDRFGSFKFTMNDKFEELEKAWQKYKQLSIKFNLDERQD